jgi:hypothetical protein
MNEDAMAWLVIAVGAYNNGATADEAARIATSAMAALKETSE